MTKYSRVIVSHFFSLFLWDDDVDAKKEKKEKGNQREINTNIGSRLGLHHSTDFALNYGDKLLSRHDSYSRWARALATLHPRGKWISDAKTIILQWLRLLSLPRCLLAFLAQGDLHIIFLVFISFSYASQDPHCLF